ncbi:MAG: YicC family protein [Gammaproteobacteria bacterium]|nr:YicC family protein [Gammaproteobacteria bacterium]MDH5630604.1 YicC family protein [Gammaproteobacteria bacterium]
MIRSMTAFARQTLESDWGNLTLELRSVNSRYLETNFRLPETFRYLEFKLRDILRKQLQRGKVDCTIKLDTTETGGDDISINENLVKLLVSSHQSLQQMTEVEQKPDLMRFLSWPGVIKTRELDIEQAEIELTQCLKSAIDDLIRMREREGESLKQIIVDKLAEMESQTKQVREEMPKIIQWQREKLMTRFEEVQLDFDEQRFEQEMVLLAQKVDVIEELDRLDAHIKEVGRLVDKGGAIGRRLDFLMQELNREANTLGSKSINSQTTSASVELKVLIEQMREQIQNIE